MQDNHPFWWQWETLSQQLLLSLSEKNMYDLFQQWDNHVRQIENIFPFFVGHIPELGDFKAWSDVINRAESWILQQLQNPGLDIFHDLFKQISLFLNTILQWVNPQRMQETFQSFFNQMITNYGAG